MQSNSYLSCTRPLNPQSSKVSPKSPVARPQMAFKAWKQSLRCRMRPSLGAWSRIAIHLLTVEAYSEVNVLIFHVGCWRLWNKFLMYVFFKTRMYLLTIWWWWLCWLLFIIIFHQGVLIHRLLSSDRCLHNIVLLS